jgi:hypothetical protein
VISVSGPKGSPQPLWVIVPGTLFWPLVVIGAVTGNGALIGAAIVLGLVTAIVFITGKVRSSSAARAERERVWAEGTPATATVVSLDGTGASINNDLEVDLVLDVSAAGRPPYRATVRRYVSPLVIPRVQPGCTLDARVDPADPSTVVLDPEL